MDLNNVLQFLESVSSTLRTVYHVGSIGIFGSYAKHTETSKSDLDVLVDFLPEGETFDNYMDLKFFLEDNLGLKIDLVVKSSLREEIRDSVLETVEYTG